MLDLKKLEYALTKDSLCDAERVSEALAIVKEARRPSPAREQVTEAVKALVWEEDHGIAGLGPYRLFKAETPLGRYVYGTDAEGAAYYHTASSGILMVGDEATAKRLAEAAWEKAALAEVAKFAALSPSPTDGEARGVGEIVSVEGSLGDMHVIKWTNDHTPKVGDKLYAHPAPLMDKVGWRSMDSAPKDGTPILITRPTEFGTECGWHVVRWEDDWWTCHDGKFDTPLRGNDPTHWMPLPAAPALTKLQEGGR